MIDAIIIGLCVVFVVLLSITLEKVNRDRKDEGRK